MNHHRQMWAAGTRHERWDPELIAQVIAERERRIRNRINNCADERVDGKPVL